MQIDLAIELESKVSKTVQDTLTITNFRKKITFKLNNPYREFSLTDKDLKFMIKYLNSLLEENQ